MEKREELSFPDWLEHKENYHARHDSSRYLIKNISRLGSLAANLREAGESGLREHSPLAGFFSGVYYPARLGGALVLIVCTAASSSLGAVLVMVAVTLAVISLHSARQISAMIGPAFKLALLNALVLLPSLWWGSPSIIAWIGIKTFVTMSITMHLVRTVPWNVIILSLKVFHMPDRLIFVVSMTFQFIDILGKNTALLMHSLSLRSVGRNQGKATSFGGILGVVFLTALQKSHEVADAMRCRGFNGKYPRVTFSYGKRATAFYAIAIGCVLACVLIFECSLFG